MLDQYRGGQGEPLLLIHGIGSTWRVWKPVMKRLEERHDVLAVDVPGFGRSEALPEGTTPSMEALGDALEQTLDEAGWDTPHLAGNSMGGWLSLELARRGRAATVTAISPAGMWTDREGDWAARSLKLQHAVATRLEPYADALTRSAIGRTLLFSGVSTRPWLMEPADAAESFRLFAGCPGWLTTLEAMRHDQPRDLGQVECPVRIVWGSRDTLLLPRQAHRFVRHIPGAELVTLRGLGHVPMSDDANGIADSILEFTARHSRERAAA